VQRAGAERQMRIVFMSGICQIMGYIEQSMTEWQWFIFGFSKDCRYMTLCVYIVVLVQRKGSQEIFLLNRCAHISFYSRSYVDQPGFI